MNLVPFGLTSDNRLVEATETERGLAADCVCPGCAQPLIAKQGEWVIWHFAHYQDHAPKSSGGRSCAETSLHRKGKEIIVARGGLILPSLRDAYGIHGYSSNVFVHSGRLEVPLTTDDGRQVRVDALLTISPQVPGEYLPKVNYAGKRLRRREYDKARTGDLIVELAVSNYKTAEHMDRFEKLGISSVEVELNWDMVQRRVAHTGSWMSALRYIIRSVNDNKRWLYNRRFGQPDYPD